MAIEKLRGNKSNQSLFIKGVSGWSIGIYTGESPLHLHPPKTIHNPVLTARDVTDVLAVFVADPFIIKKNSLWYMFFEVFNGHSRKGEIGLATSVNGLRWEYKNIVLQESFHLSYPYVFEWDNEYFMVPESEFGHSIRLYKAVHFPAQWKYVCTILQGEYADTSLLYYQEKWWMFTVELKENDMLHLYYADMLTGPWTQHPQSPIVRGNASMARPAGRVILFNGRIIRYAQDCATSYGERVRAFEITTLTTTRYEEHEVSESPVIKASGVGWNKKGMHTVDPHRISENNWIAAVDGFEKDLLFVSYEI